MRQAFRIPLAIVAATTMGATPPQAQDVPRVFSGASAWAIDYADDSCRLTRDFASGGEIITLALERYQPGDTVYVALVSDAISRAHRQVTARLRFKPEAVGFESSFMGYELEDGRNYYSIGPVRLEVAATTSDRLEQVLSQPYRPADEIAAARKLGALTVTEGFDTDFALELGPMAPPVEALQACVDDLLTQWGVDVERHRSMTRAATPAEDPQTWVAEADYPAEERHRRNAGSSSVRLMLDAAGRPTSCHARQRSRTEGFNETACRILMERGRFVPALDAAGEPMASYYVVDFQFQLNVIVRGA